MDHRRPDAAVLIGAVCLAASMGIPSDGRTAPLGLVPDASFLGEAADEPQLGAVAAAGDVDGDGLDDLLLGVPNALDAGQRVGEAYLVSGRTSGWALETSLADSDASFLGEDFSDYAGGSLAGVGDVNGDGFDDFLVAARDNSESFDHAGQVYLLMGKAAGWAMETSLSGADASFLGEQQDAEAGRALAGGGDLDGDGLDDLVIGSPQYANDHEWAGKIWIVLGRTEGWAMDLSLADADATFEGSASDHLGHAVAVVGDVNGDGYDDILAGAPHCAMVDYAAGGAWLLPGAPREELGDFTTTATIFLGQYWGDSAGWSVAAAGDVDSDGFDDMLVGAPGNGNYASDAGRTYLVRGREQPWGTVEPLVAMDGIYQGMSVSDNSGLAVAGGADVDGDGYDDVLIGAPGADTQGLNVGAAYLVRGSPEIPDGLQMLVAANGDVQGQYGGDDLGSTVAMVGDVNGDDLADILVGAPGVDNPTTDAGAAYLVFGISSEDTDGDGFELWDHDCDDTDPTIYPGAEEVCADGIDSDCADDLRRTEEDNDEDGYAECEGDCEDHDSHFHPAALEVCDGYDTDCDGVLQEYLDVDGDGFDLCEQDCDDSDTGTFPGAPEACDGIDNDCDNKVDEGFDFDGDGFSSCTEGDCDDADRLIYPGAPEIPYDGIDQDCDATDLIDVDGDGHPGGPRGTDCDDLLAWVFPDAVEVCTDGVDADCDGLSDAEDPDCGLPGCGCSATPRAAPHLLLLLAVLVGICWARHSCRMNVDRRGRCQRSAISPCSPR